ncbi:transcriptional regulator FeaR [Thauera sinica]|uniref:Transcriptional regulator FeaR n=1 Tax=Thauera sinica TaxID=2665146 RepID=A0ABW1AT18_9RHOO|nr:transcriptional regulator FeaR [Thauera sp. K11]
MIEESLERWNSAVRSICGRFATAPARELPVFVGRIAKTTCGGLDIAHISTNAASIHHTRSISTDAEFCFLVLQQSGVMDVEDADSPNGGFRLLPGDVALLDSARDFRMRPNGLIGQLSVHLSRSVIDRALPGRLGHMSKVSQHCASGWLLRGLLQQVGVGDTMQWADDADGDALEMALIHLMRPALGERSASENGVPMRVLANRLIDRSLCDPNLAPGGLARQLGISERQLYRIFSVDGDTVFRYIMRKRLERSAADLLGRGADGWTITDVAFKWGFVDSAHFSRAFRRQYGMSPSEYRNGGGAAAAPVPPPGERVLQ